MYIFKIWLRNIHLVIATPGRLIDHIMRGTINLKNLKTVVFDEADEMLFMGFKNDIETIMKDVPKKSQVFHLRGLPTPL